MTKYSTSTLMHTCIYAFIEIYAIFSPVYFMLSLYNYCIKNLYSMYLAHVIGPRGRDSNSWSAISSVLSAIVEIVDYRIYHHLLRLSFSFQSI